VTPTRTLVGLALASTVFLTGCNASGWNPGVAARVGDETISMSEVDDVTATYCHVLAGNPQNTQVVAQRYARGRVASNLVLRSAAEQFADEQGITAAPSYDETVRQAEDSGSFDGLSDSEKQAVIDVDGASYYVQAVQEAAGDDGEKLFNEWLADHTPEFDPRLGISIDEGTTVTEDTSLSVGVSDVSGQADASEPDTDYAGALPENQRCGG
jgi:hypothetical protein